MKPRRRCRRFSLLEVIIAIGILTVIIAILLFASNTIMKSWNGIQDNSNTLDDTLALDRTLDNILNNIVPFTWPDADDNNRERPVFIGAPDHMVCCYIHAFNRLEDGALRFCTFVQEDDELVIYYTDRPPFPTDLREDRVQRSVISENVQSISFQYVDQDGKDPVLLDDWEEREYAPLGVWLRITWKDGTYDDWLRRTAGAGYYERWGDWNQQSQDVRGGTQR